MPAPTRVYELVITRLRLEGTEHVADLAEVNDLASQGYDVQQFLAIGSGFVFLMSRTVTAKEGESSGERTG